MKITTSAKSTVTKFSLGPWQFRKYVIEGTGALFKKLGGMCSWAILTPYPVQDQDNWSLRPCSRTKDEKDTLSSRVDGVSKQYRFFIEHRWMAGKICQWIKYLFHIHSASQLGHSSIGNTTAVIDLLSHKDWSPHKRSQSTPLKNQRQQNVTVLLKVIFFL